MAILGMIKTNGNGDYEELKSLAGTYGIIFVVNLLFEVMVLGGIGALTAVIFGDAVLKSALTMFMIYAANKGIRWRETKGE